MKTFTVNLRGSKIVIVQDADGKFIIPKHFKGLGSALKPAAEFWILARKPISEKTVAANVLKHGTGGINIDGSRIEGVKPQVTQGVNSNGSGFKVAKERRLSGPPNQGRFPANLVLSHSSDCTDDQCDLECAVLALDAQSGTLKSGARAEGVRKGVGYHGGKGDGGPAIEGNSGGASRFFYCAKVSPSERGKDNKHPTVKPIKLMAYLIKLITPPNGIVLDPFAGSGSTGVAAIREGFRFVGIEKQLDYYQIAEARLVAEVEKSATSDKPKEQDKEEAV